MVPTKIANASWREIDRDATRIATENENTMPTFAKVRIIPDAMPNMSGGAAFMIAELLAGKNRHAPIALIVPTHDDPPQRRRVAELRVQQQGTTCSASPAVAGSTGPYLSASRPA